ncbi:MAG: T9SS type A sorting domain-containing protein [Aequorivita sp.]
MGKIILFTTIFFTFIFQSSGQINPISNLTWEHYYVMPNNYFELSWDEPVFPHDELIGYNVYRENELYRFQTETFLYNLEQGSNCDIDFLLFDDGFGFNVHVTAVYNPGPVESSYSETIYVEGAMIKIDDYKKPKVMVYPNPTKGILFIENVDLKKIEVYNPEGKKIKELAPKSEIDLSDISKGLYFVKLISEKGILMEKIILE